MRFQHLLSLLGLVDTISALSYGHRTIYELKQKVNEANQKRSTMAKRDTIDPELLYPAHNLSVPVDFFPDSPRYEPHSNDTFNLRYWFDASHYKPGGPVFVLLSGETSGVGRLPFLQKGIVAQVAEATNGIGVILEHRYYGTSFPVPSLSIENFRFLTTEQSLAEIDYFARNVKFDGIDGDLTAPNTPWIVYGGSYAGAQAAFMRVAYPETFWGAISSSGVTKAIYEYWEYFEPIRQHAPPDTVANTQTFIDVVDKILFSNSTENIKKLKDAFGLGGISNNQDFAGVFYGITGWQGTNWDPEDNSPSFWYYANNMTTTLNNDATESKRPVVKELLTAAGYTPSTAVENIILNAINYYGRTSVAGWSRSNVTQDEYFTTLNDTFWQQDDIAQQTWRSWNYQVCTEWGYIQTGNTPADIKPLISRKLDLEYLTHFCRASFNITTPPDVDQVNKYGAFDIEYERLAIIGGNADPWKPATPLADAARDRNSTTEKPFHEIAHGVHHWEENGIFKNETTPILPPNQVVWAQQFLKNFVIEWLKEFDAQKSRSEL